MCGHGPRISRSRLSIFYFHRTNSPNPWRPDLKENEAVGAAIWQNHLSHFFGFIAIFVFHRVFSNKDGPSRFFPALGFRRLQLVPRNPFARNEVRSPKTEVKVRVQVVPRNPFARNAVRSPKTAVKLRFRVPVATLPHEMRLDRQKLR